MQWIKSSFCTGSACMQVASEGPTTLLRDSRNPHVGFVSFTPQQWLKVLDQFAGEFGSFKAGPVTFTSNGHSNLVVSDGSVMLTFTRDEVEAFRLGVLHGEFRLVA